MRSVEPGDPLWPYVTKEHAKMVAARARVLVPAWPVFAPTQQGAGLILGQYGQTNGVTTFMEIVAMNEGAGPQITVRTEVVGVRAIQSLDEVLTEKGGSSSPPTCRYP